MLGLAVTLVGKSTYREFRWGAGRAVCACVCINRCVSVHTYHVFDFGQLLLLEGLQLVAVIPLLEQSQALLRQLLHPHSEHLLLLGRHKALSV